MEYVKDQKFTQNQEHKSKLMATEGNLYEATLDLFFGSGLLLAQKAKFETAEQKGQNRIGLKLIDLRGKYMYHTESEILLLENTGEELYATISFFN